jgi:hypothetical protein
LSSRALAVVEEAVSWRYALNRPGMPRGPGALVPVQHLQFIAVNFHERSSCVRRRLRPLPERTAGQLEAQVFALGHVGLDAGEPQVGRRLRNRRWSLETRAARASDTPGSPVGATAPASFHQRDAGGGPIANRAWIARTLPCGPRRTQVSRLIWPLTCANVGGRDRHQSVDLPRSGGSCGFVVHATPDVRPAQRGLSGDRA